jgi:hypothetical protein
VQPAQHLRQGVAPGDLEEAVALQRVDRDVHALDTGGRQRHGIPLEQVAIGRQREVADARDRGEHRGEPGEVPADQRLAAGEAHLLDPQGGHQADQPLDLLEAEELVALEPGHPLGRHAVLAAEVAAVRYGDAQVGDPAPVPVVQGFSIHRWRHHPPQHPTGNGSGHPRVCV